MLYDKILEKFNLKYEDLTEAERETLNQWTDTLSNNSMTVDMIKTYIMRMREAVSIKLSDASLSSKADSILKARLQNYILLEKFLTSPEEAKKALERTIASIKPKR